MDIRHDLDIACQQVLRRDASVFSEQWTIFGEESGFRSDSEALLEAYLRHVRRFTLSLVRPVQRGDWIDFRLVGSDISLLRFQIPREKDPHILSLAICGGILVQRDSCDRGELTFACEPVPGGTRVLLRLSDFCPMLLGGPAPSRPRKWLYRLTQAGLHRLVTVRFLIRLHREFQGRRACFRVVRVQEMEGERI